MSVYVIQNDLHFVGNGYECLYVIQMSGMDISAYM
jgi:hypothetical protein